jgi:diacylglycerol kinase family enzyme
VRALLIVNPHATSTTVPRREVIVRALGSEVELDVVQTRYRGHAWMLAAEAAEGGYQAVFTLGGDGTINEVVNGLLCGGACSDSSPGDGGPGSGPGDGGPGDSGPGSGPGDGGPGDSGPGGGADAKAAAAPALAPLPGGSANVFVQALGIPTDPVDATGLLLQAIRTGRERRVGLGLAGERYFTFNAGLGLDAEVVRAVEGLRAQGRSATPVLYVRAAVRQFYSVTDRHHPALQLERDGHEPIEQLFVGIVSNTSPWTYLGTRPVNPNPLARFDTGLDIFALRRLRTVSTVNALRQMLATSGQPLRGRHVVSLHDQKEMTLRSHRPIACQVDGEYVGERECLTFRSVPGVLRVIC